MDSTTQKWDKKLSHILKAKTVIGGLTNKNYNFNPGVGSVNIPTASTMPLNAYDASGNFRFGQINDIELTWQTFNLDESIAFTGVIDAVTNSQNLRILKPGAVMASQTKERIIPYIDTYVLEAMYAAITAVSQDEIVTPGDTTSANAWENFLALRSYSIDNEGPQTGYKAVGTSSYYNDLKQSGFATDSDAGQRIRTTGLLGRVDGTPFVMAPSNRMPDNVDLMIVHPIGTTYVTQLKQFDVIPKAVGFSGPVLQGVQTFDAFVDANKVQVMTAHLTQS